MPGHGLVADDLEGCDVWGVDVGGLWGGEGYLINYR